MSKKRVNETKLGWGGWETGRGCVTGDTDLDACTSISMCVCLPYINVSVSCSCTLERGSLVGRFTPSLARSFFSSSLSTSSCRECWDTRCACQPEGQNIPIWLILEVFWALREGQVTVRRSLVEENYAVRAMDCSVSSDFIYSQHWDYVIFMQCPHWLESLTKFKKY